MTMTDESTETPEAPLERRQAPAVRVKAEPLTYRRDVQHSYFRDLAASQGLVAPRGGESDRQTRHRAEMDVVRATRAANGQRRLDAEGFETRVNPNTKAGTGGNFAPPLWLNELFATAPRSGQVLAALIEAQFPLPSGISSINLPILTTGSLLAPALTDAAVVDRDITDATGSSTVVTLAGQVDTSLQLLEQSPTGAHLDWALFKDMAEDFDVHLEQQLVAGVGAASKQLLGLSNVASIVNIAYTSTAPTGKGMYKYFGQAAAQIGDGRRRPPECWMMRTARYAWLMASEDSSTRPLMTPDPIIGVASILGWPVFLNDVVSAKLGVGGNQDEVLAFRPSDLILFTGEPQTAVMREVLSGDLGVRFQMHAGVAAITNRYPSGIAVLGGTGFVVQSGE